MLVLALDTTSRLGSHALVRDGQVVAVGTGDVTRPHAERLPGELLAVLEANHLTLSDVDLLSVAAGPGSFTGLRIGIASMQGLAFATGKPLVGVSALEALAYTARVLDPVGTHPVGVWMDGQRGEVFAALYGPADGAPGSSPTLAVIDEALVADPAVVAARWRKMGHGTLTMIGDGALAYRALLTADARLMGSIVEPLPPIAPAIAQLAVACFRTGGTFHPHAIVPVYIRRPDAELARDRRSAEA
jgi:tRNA threonylcarbamoyladenosine biosynthesis protein TsaB